MLTSCGLSHLLYCQISSIIFFLGRVMKCTLYQDDLTSNCTETRMLILYLIGTLQRRDETGSELERKLAYKKHIPSLSARSEKYFNSYRNALTSEVYCINLALSVMSAFVDLCFRNDTLLLSDLISSFARRIYCFG